MTTFRQRSGATLVEAAIVFPVLIFLILGVIVGGMGVFHYQQAACLAQEAARYASVRGGGYQRDTNQDSPTTAQILQAVLPFAPTLDAEHLSLTVLWVDQGTGTGSDWDAASKDVKSITPGGEYVSNTVRVT